MQKKRLSVLFAAGALASLFSVTEAQAAAGCLDGQNRIMVYYTLGGGVPTKFCKAINNDIEIKRDSFAFEAKGITAANVKTMGETGTCSFYLFTRGGNRHYRFNIGDYEEEGTKAKPNTYFGFRLGC